MTTDRPDSRQRHRSAVRKEILLPFGIGLVGIVILLVVVALAGEAPTSGVSTTLLTFLMLCPLAICLFPIYVVLVLAVVGMNRAHDAIASPLRRLEALSLSLRERTRSVSDRAAQITIQLNARVAPLDKLLFSLFDRPDQPKDDHE